MENSFDPNGVWRLVHVEVEQVEKFYLCCTSPYVEVHYSLVLERIGNFYVYSIWIPSGLLSSMILAVFVMHPNSGEKVTLSVSNVLAFVLFQQIVVGSMPRSGDDSPVIVAYFSAMIAISCLSVLASAVVLRVYHHDPKKPVPRVFKWLLLRNKTDRVTESSSVELRYTNLSVSDENRHDISTIHKGACVVPMHTNQSVSNENRHDISTIPKGYDDSITDDVIDDQSLNINHKPTDISFCEPARTNRQPQRNQEETDWMILALMMDKVLLAIAVFAMFSTLMYCGINYIVLV